MQLIFPVTLGKITVKKPYLVTFFFIVQHCSLFMGIIFCSSVALVWIFNARSGHNFITKEPNIPVNLVLQWCLVPILSLLEVWSNEWAKKYFSLKEQKSQCYLFQTVQNFAAHKTLAWSTYIWRTTTATIKRKKRVIYDIGSHLNRIRFI